MDKSNVIWLFGRKVKVVTNDDKYTPCKGCVMKDICDRLCGYDDYICATNDGSYQKFIKAE